MSKLPVDLTQSLFVSGAELAHLSARPLPGAPDGHYDYEALAAGETNGKSDAHSRIYTLVDNAQEAVRRGAPISDPKAVEGILNFLANKEAIDDRKGFFTTALSAITKLPPGPVQNKANDVAIATLYETLPHPPATFLGPQYSYRSADGSGNNPLQPELGKAGLQYARSVQGRHPLPMNTLPDPGLVFDTLLKARDFQPHPGRNSSLTFAFASLVTHSLFRTDSRDWTKNNTSSYLDLSPLYGNDQFTQNQVRNKELGRGMLYPDTFSEDRLGFLPPAASALLVIFSRNHNYIANMLLKINERKRWSDPPPSDPKACAQQDEEIFQTARLVNCGHFMALIFGDYVSGFLGLGRDGNTWSMNPFDPIKTQSGEVITRGEGNHVSVEFNVLYRWHATTAQEDIKWTEDEFNTIFNGKALDQVDLSDFRTAAVNLFSTVEPDPKKRTFGGMKRQADGTFSDDELAKILHDSTEKCAGAYRARGTPAALRIIEIMGMQQARQWGVCTMNEFRKFLGLKQFASFEEWSSDPEIAGAARRLYNHIDNLELYPGLQAEDCMALGPGSGICCGYTMTRAILADAIALVRGDRYYTTDYTPTNLTSWGYQDCARDPDNGAFGAALPRLLFRHLPRHYSANNVYALFPFFTPQVTFQNLTKLGIAEKYDFNRPKTTPIPKVLNTLTGIRYVFNDFKKFHQIYEADMKMLTDGYGFMLTFDDQKTHSVDKALVWHALFPSKDSVGQYVEWYKGKTRDLLKQKSFQYDGVPGTYVDIIKDVINLISVHWAADKLCGIPLKTAANPRGLFTEQEVYDMFTVLFMCVFENIQPEHGWVLRSAASQVGKIINGLIAQSLTEAAPRTASNPLVGIFTSVKEAIWPTPPKECHDFLANLAASGRPTRDLVACVIGLAVGSSVNYAQAVAQVVDFYLDDSRAAERAQLVAACARDDKKGAELLRGYVREGMRLNPQFGGLFRAAVQDDLVPQGAGFQPLQVRAGDLLFAGFKNAHLNPADFPNPTAVDPTRPKDSYQLQGAGFHNCPGVDFAADTIPEIIKIIFRLPNIRRAPAPAGTCARFDQNSLGTDNRFYISNTGNMSPWPGSLQIVYDA
ncbi:heme peroxidase [Phellopilus nigrolimitatus]|nr:heme peroxidase [Phellopilus nigrolimitatus]